MKRSPKRFPRIAAACGLALGVCSLGTGCTRGDHDRIDEAAVRTALVEGAQGREGSKTWKHLDPAVGRTRAGAGSWDDRREGPATTFYESGVRQSEGSYENGEKNGLWQFWYENGHLRWQGTYVENEVVGKVLTWHDSGELETISEYKGGERNGRLLSFWEDGMPRSEGNYESDEKSGMFFYWGRDGNPDAERSGLYERDKRVRALHASLLSAAERPAQR